MSPVFLYIKKHNIALTIAMKSATILFVKKCNTNHTNLIGVALSEDDAKGKQGD